MPFGAVRRFSASVRCIEPPIVRRQSPLWVAGAPTFASLCAELRRNRQMLTSPGAPDHHAYVGMEAAGVAHSSA